MFIAFYLSVSIAICIPRLKAYSKMEASDKLVYQMVNYKEILRLSHKGYNQRQIESSVHCSRHTVRDTLSAAERNGIVWPLEESVTDEQIGAILFPERHSEASTYLEPDYAYTTESSRNAVSR